jgi:uncharacterized membrane protein YhaH (DUF805 family)
MAAGGKRPFWMHQIVEYILGGALVASGLQSPTPVVPAVLGGLIMLNAALTKGALCAFRAYDRGMHRIFDIAIIILCFASLAQPWVEFDMGTKVVVFAITTVQVVVFFGSDYSERKKKAAKPAPVASSAGTTGDTGTSDTVKGDKATDLGKSAGRVVGSGVNFVRKWGKSDDAS